MTSPQPPPLMEARYFLDRLEQEGLHLAGVVVNRLHPLIDVDTPPEALRTAGRRLADTSDQDGVAVGHALALLADLAGLASRERRDVDAALHGRRVGAMIEVPLLRRDVHDLAGLHTIADHLAPRRRDADRPA